MKKISVAIPTFGKSLFLAECLQSIADQTYPTEGVVCDGGSSFNFFDSKWSWVKRKQMRPDPGLVVCWSEAANVSQGDYIAFLADDNALEAQFSEQMLCFMEAHPTCEVVFCNQYVMDGAGQVHIAASHEMTRKYGRHKLKYGLLRPSDVTYLIQHNSIPLEGCVLKRSVWEQYGPFAQQAFGALDLHCFTNLLARGVQFGFLPSYLVRFRVHSGSYSNRQRKQHLQGAIWAMQNIHSSDQAINQLMTTRVLASYGQLLRLNIPFEERVFIQKQLCRSALGIHILAKATLSYYVRRVLGK